MSMGRRSDCKRDCLDGRAAHRGIVRANQVPIGMVRFLLRPMRRFVQADIMKELALLQAEVAALRRDAMLRDDLKPMIRQMEAALLAITLSRSGRQ